MLTFLLRLTRSADSAQLDSRPQWGLGPRDRSSASPPPAPLSLSLSLGRSDLRSPHVGRHLILGEWRRRRLREHLAQLDAHRDGTVIRALSPVSTPATRSSPSRSSCITTLARRRKPRRRWPSRPRRRARCPERRSSRNCHHTLTGQLAGAVALEPGQALREAAAVALTRSWWRASSQNAITIGTMTMKL